MTTDKYPESGSTRLSKAKQRRTAGTALMHDIASFQTANNGDNAAYDDTALMTFTKGLEHDPATGFAVPADVHIFAEELTSRDTTTETRQKFMVPRSMTSYIENAKGFRIWESPLAGMAYENEGPDPDQVSMAPAPKFGESELCAEMSEVYAMALVRDMPFSEIEDATSALRYVTSDGKETSVSFELDGKGATMQDLIDALNSLNWFKSPGAVTSTLGESSTLTDLEQRRQMARGENSPVLTAKSLFRGSSPGCKDGPYISQFLLQGAGKQGPGGEAWPKNSGAVAYGAQTISQKVSTNAPGIDWMTDWAEWLSVQNGVSVGGEDVATNKARFITTPRDLATYVHVDQLYQAYFVACLMMLEQGVPGDQGFPEMNAAKTRAPFATFGGPHILSQMTEVASRALRAVRRQKFQIHRRARPERLAAMITLAKGHADGTAVLKKAEPKMMSMLTELGLNGMPTGVTAIMGWVNALNTDRNGRKYYKLTEDGEKLERPIKDGHNYLLPMAFPEGSPMHPAYGAGHATVAGACTTVLKAFFDIYEGASSVGYSASEPDLQPKLMSAYKLDDIFQPDLASKPPGSKLKASGSVEPLTIEGELNKLAANIAIGRNFAGVHYYTDYYDSLRMGERIAIGILREHLIAHPEPVAMHLRSFDSDTIRIQSDGHGGTTLLIWDATGQSVSKDAWWTRDISEFAARSTEDAALVAGVAGSTSNWEV